MATTMRAVVLEDDYAVRQLLECVLGTEDWQCSSGASIDDVAGAMNGADLVLLDHHLPGRAGLDVLGDLREVGIAATVVVLTGDPALRRKAKRRGADHFLLKPFEVADLLAILRGVASGAAPTIDLTSVPAAAAPAPERPWFASG